MFPTMVMVNHLYLMFVDISLYVRASNGVIIWSSAFGLMPWYDNVCLWVYGNRMV